MSISGIGEIADLASSIIGRIWPDKTQEEKDKAALELQAALQAAQAQSAQTDIDKVEAASNSIFVAGWRPFVGWVCGCGFGIQVLGPLFEWLAALFGHPVKFPVMDASLVGSTLAALLGLGGMRSWDKKNGTASGH
jgi:hypothetical protein